MACRIEKDKVRGLTAVGNEHAVSRTDENAGNNDSQRKGK